LLWHWQPPLPTPEEAYNFFMQVWESDSEKEKEKEKVTAVTEAVTEAEEEAVTAEPVDDTDEV